MTPRHRIALAVLRCTLVLAVPPLASQAQAQALQFSNDGGFIKGYTGTLGWQFTVNQDATLTAFGIYNAAQPVTTAYQIGIFDLTGALLDSGTVGPTASDSVLNDFDFAPTTPFSLLAGQSYVIGELLSPSDIFYYDPSSITTDPRLTYVQSQYDAADTPSLTFPASSSPPSDGYGYFGPNFEVTPAGMTVPEPGVFPAFVLFLAGLVALRLGPHRHRPPYGGVGPERPVSRS